MMSSAGGQPASGGIPYGLMSLWDMINCFVSSACSLCSQLMLLQVIFEERPQLADSPDDLMGDWSKDQVQGWLRVARKVADNFELKAANDRIALIEKRLQKGMTYREVSIEARVLRETIDAGMKRQQVYRYPEDKGGKLSNWKQDWAPVLDAFPAAGPDILAAVDLWALDHSTASVFHLMRVLEHGLRALAENVGRSFDVQNWQNIIDEIESEIRTQAKTLPKGLEKSERLRFLSEAAKEFMYFKDGWRNYVSHNRSTYDEYQARSVLEHVRTFMMVLSTQLGETPEAGH
jgi:hypothetical protein